MHTDPSVERARLGPQATPREAGADAKPGRRRVRSPPSRLLRRSPLGSPSGPRTSWHGSDRLYGSLVPLDARARRMSGDLPWRRSTRRSRLGGLRRRPNQAVAQRAADMAHSDGDRIACQSRRFPCSNPSSSGDRGAGYGSQGRQRPARLHAPTEAAARRVQSTPGVRSGSSSHLARRAPLCPRGRGDGRGSTRRGVLTSSGWTAVVSPYSR
jgi:hypothetical protein